MSHAKTQLDDVFDALANAHRRAVVHHLSLQPASISELAKKQQLSLQSIHKHIKVLERAKLLKRKKSGRCHFLALDHNALLILQEWILQYHAYWGAEESSLENYIAEIEKKEKRSIKK